MAGSGRAHFEVVDSAVRGLSKVQTYIEHGMNDVIEVALDLADNGGDVEGSLRDLQVMMKEYIAMDTDLLEYNQAVTAVIQQMKEQDPQADFNVKNELKTQVDRAAAGPRPDTEEHEKLKELREKLWQLQNPGSEMLSQQTEVDPTQGDDEPMISQVEVSTKCPISQAEMADPVKNKVCCHSYERKAVQAFMKQRHGARCPVTACTNKQPLSQRCLADNTTLKNFIDRRNRQAGKKGI